MGTATCRAISALFSAEAVRAIGAFHSNLVRQVFVTVLLALAVWATGAAMWPGLPTVLGLAGSGVLGILLGDTFNFAAAGRLGPPRAGAVFALNAPMAAALAFAGAALAVAGLALIFLRAG